MFDSSTVCQCFPTCSFLYPAEQLYPFAAWAQGLSCFSSTILLTFKVLTVFGKIPTPNMLAEIFWVRNHVKLGLFKSTFTCFLLFLLGGVTFCLQLYSPSYTVSFQCDIWMFPCFTFQRIMTHSHLISGFYTSYTIVHSSVVEVAGEAWGSSLCFVNMEYAYKRYL